jgi:hypothetical protein
MRSLLITLLLLVSASSVVAQPPLTITKSGYYITEVNAEGVPTLVKLTVVVDPTNGGTPAPNPPDVVDIDTAVVKQVKEWSKAVNDPQGAQAVAAVYSHIKGAVDDSLLNATSAWPALKDATDNAITIVDGTEKWKVFRDQLSALVTEGRQRGTLQSQKAVSVFLRSVQQGLELSADGSNALSLDILTTIATKTNEAIDANK